MKQTWTQWGMMMSVEIVDDKSGPDDITAIQKCFTDVDERFSTYKPRSEISQINAGTVAIENASDEVKHIFELAENTKQETNGYFDILHDGIFDPLGIVKGWAIYEVAKQLWKKGYQNFFIDAGGDIQVSGVDSRGEKWSVGIRNPFNSEEIVKVLKMTDCGIATSGSYNRGGHIYNPKLDSLVRGNDKTSEVVSITVIGPDVYEADRFATAAFAMGQKGIQFIEGLDGFEGYQIDQNAIATFTSHFDDYLP